MPTDELRTTAASLIEGGIDAHVHGAPDIVDRRMSVTELAQDAKAHGMHGVIVLNHYSDTAPQAAIVDDFVDGVTVRGGIKLNRPAGGLNPEAVDIALQLGAVKVDMPTQHAANELQAKGEHSEKGISILEEDSLRSEVHDILDLVADAGATVATGHLSPREIAAVVDAAFEHGIDHPVVSHPTLPSVQLPIETQVRLAERGAVMEYCYVTTTDVLRAHFPDWTPYDPAHVLAQADQVGADSTVLATDFGQSTNPAPTTGLMRFVADALEYGFSERDIVQMVRETPKRVYNF